MVSLFLDLANIKFRVPEGRGREGSRHGRTSHPRRRTCAVITKFSSLIVGSRRITIKLSYFWSLPPGDFNDTMMT